MLSINNSTTLTINKMHRRNRSYTPDGAFASSPPPINSLPISFTIKVVVILSFGGLGNHQWSQDRLCFSKAFRNSGLNHVGRWICIFDCSEGYHKDFTEAMAESHRINIRIRREGVRIIELTLPPKADPPMAEYPSLRKRGTYLPFLL